MSVYGIGEYLSCIRPYNSKVTRRSTAEVRIIGDVKNEFDISCFRTESMDIWIKDDDRGVLLQTSTSSLSKIHNIISIAFNQQ